MSVHRIAAVPEKFKKGRKAVGSSTGKLIRLRITPTLRNEWQVRDITAVIPALANVPWETLNVVEVDTAIAREIRADCAWYIDPKAVDATAGERAAYRAMLRQIEAAPGMIDKAIR